MSDLTAVRDELQRRRNEPLNFGAIAFRYADELLAALTEADEAQQLKRQVEDLGNMTFGGNSFYARISELQAQLFARDKHLAILEKEYTELEAQLAEQRKFWMHDSSRLTELESQLAEREKSLQKAKAVWQGRPKLIMYTDWENEMSACFESRDKEGR